MHIFWTSHWVSSPNTFKSSLKKIKMRHFYKSTSSSLTSFIIIFSIFFLLVILHLPRNKTDKKIYAWDFFVPFSVSSSIISSQNIYIYIYFFIIYFLDRFYGFFMSYNNALTYVGIFAHVKAQQDFPIILLKGFFAQFFMACTHMNVFFCCT